MILDRFASKAGVAFHVEKKWRAEIAAGGPVLLCKPLSYMNLSGEPVASVSGFHKIPASEILVVLDDAALPLGKLRIRHGGSSGGHNGLQSIVNHVGNVSRLRVGIGAANGAMTGHVLGRFTAGERPVLEETLQRAVEAIDFIQTNGIEAAMNQFN
jgi:PTH1 family peptidyl-tRNA hydrolase